MRMSDAQEVFACWGFYSGPIDGYDGPLTEAAVEAVERIHYSKYPASLQRWSRRRRVVAAVQVLLDVGGFEPGFIDGQAGHNTSEALIAWRSEKAGVSWSVSIDPVKGARTHPNQALFPRQADMRAFYGTAGGPQCTAGEVVLPFPMVLAWNKQQVIRRFFCHEKLARPFTDIFRHAASHYGQADIERLNLNVYGGCFNHRKKRGGDTLSTHAYGAALDLNPAKNQLRWGADRAQFAQPDYQPFWNIVMAHGGTPAGYAWGADWMHFQFARL